MICPRMQERLFVFTACYHYYYIIFEKATFKYKVITCACAHERRRVST
uniref:Uncharacterized protein n=1 Tax=Lepeophtheirus salmonis TaxID=72036 RepID=A0A0K2VKB1_LEPSM